MKVGKLSSHQLACLRGAAAQVLICSYGNQFFIPGDFGVRWRDLHPEEPRYYQRNTCESLRRLGFLSYRPGTSQRGEYTITEAGRKALK